MVAEVRRVLEANAIKFTQSANTFTFYCADEAVAGDVNAKQAGPIEFEIEVCKIEKLALYGLHFRRVRGNTWPYTQICQKLMQQFRL